VRIDIISIFPDLVRHWFEQGVVGRALGKADAPARLHYWNPRDYSEDRHQRVDDRPFGGGPGMMEAANLLVPGIIAKHCHRPIMTAFLIEISFSCNIVGC